MSTNTDRDAPEIDSDDPWEQLAEHRDALRIFIDEDTAFAEQAQILLDRLDEEGY